VAGGGARKRRAARFVTNKIVNPLVRRAIEAGMPGTGAALLETTGRKTGRVRRTPVGNGLRGGQFWIVTEHGHHSSYVKNIEADPRVRVKVGRRWFSGTARILTDDDPYARIRWLGRRVNDSMLRLVGTEHLVVRVDLDQ
jgi:deazaflavin-dependent oxidoreductase (nitroreductase family)